MKCAKIKEVFVTRTDLLLKDVSLIIAADTKAQELDLRLQAVLMTEVQTTTTEASEPQEIMKVMTEIWLRMMTLKTNLNRGKKEGKSIIVCLNTFILMKLKISL